MSSTQFSGAEHDAIIELLPWYANGTLEVDDHQRIAQHLPQCATCQQELEWLQVTQHSIADQPITIPPVTPGLNSVLERINAECVSQPATGTGPHSSSRYEGNNEHGRKLKAWLHKLSSNLTAPKWAAAAIACMLVVTVVIQGDIFVSSGVEDNPYQVLSAEESSQLLKLQISLDQPTTINDAQTLLKPTLIELDGPLQLTEQSSSNFVLSIPLSSLPQNNPVEAVNQLINRMQLLPEVDQTELIP